MTKQQLFENIKKKQSFLCVGLDTDIKKIPHHLLQEEDPVFVFNKAIIDATADYCVAYNPIWLFMKAWELKVYSLLKKQSIISVKIIQTNSLLPMPNGEILEILLKCMPVRFLILWTWML